MKFITNSLRVDFRAFLLEYSTFVKCVSKEHDYRDWVYTKGGFIVNCTYYAMDYPFFMSYVSSKSLNALYNRLRGLSMLGKIIYDVESDSIIYLTETEYNAQFKSVDNIIVQRFVPNYSRYKEKVKNNFGIEFIIYPRLFDANTLLYVCEIWNWDISLRFSLTEREFGEDDFQDALKKIQLIVRRERINKFRNGYMIPEYENMILRTAQKVEYNEDLPF